MRAELEETLGQKLKPTMPLLSWVPQYAAWCYNRFQPTRDDRRTPFERATLKTYDHPVLPFGERILVRTVPEGKAQARWVYGFWIGRSLLANDHVVLTDEWLGAKPIGSTSSFRRSLGPDGEDKSAEHDLDALGADRSTPAATATRSRCARGVPGEPPGARQKSADRLGTYEGLPGLLLRSEAVRPQHRLRLAFKGHARGQASAGRRGRSAGACTRTGAAARLGVEI